MSNDKPTFLNCGYPAYWRDGKIRYIHMDVAEQLIGRQLGRHEVVHHIDGNRQNNDPSNIQVMRSGKHHTAAHTTKLAIEILQTNDGSHITVKQQQPCVHCGLLFEPNAASVRYCSLACVAASQARTFVNPKQLAKEVWKKPATQLAKIYGVSDRCIGKWCDKFNIPRPGRGYWAKQRSITS